MLYLNITDEVKDANILADIKKRYSLNSLSLADVPCVLTFESGIITRIYSIKDNEYDLLKFKDFINSVGE